jgi:hypothetical protein
MNETNINIIGDFLNQKLSEEGENTFLQNLETDAELKADFEKLQLLKQVAERNRILEEAKQVHNEKIEALKSSKSSIISLPKIASFAAAASVIFMLYLGNTDFEYTKISNAERGENTKESAIVAFENGIEFLKQHKPSEAIEKLNQVIDNKELTDYYRDAARWYKVVALAEMDKDKEAKILLNQIENSAGFTYKIGWIEQWKMKIRLWF